MMIKIATKQIDCKTVVFFLRTRATVRPYSNKRSGANVKTARENEARALHTRGSRLWRFTLPKTFENYCFAVYGSLWHISYPRWPPYGGGNCLCTTRRGGLRTLCQLRKKESLAREKNKTVILTFVCSEN